MMPVTPSAMAPVQFESRHWPPFAINSDKKPPSCFMWV